MDTEKIVKNFVFSVFFGFSISLISGMAYISLGQSSYVDEGGIPLTWVASTWGVVKYDYTGFILDLIFWSFLIFLLITWAIDSPLNIKRK